MKEIILGIGRHILTTVGGVITGSAMTAPSADVTDPQVVAGAIITLIGFIASLFKNKKVSQ